MTLNKFIVINAIYLFIIIITNFYYPHIVNSNELKSNFNYKYASNSKIDSQDYREIQKKNILGLDLNYTSNVIASRFEINNINKNKFVLDGSFLNLTNGNATIGLGSVKRHWTFSPNESLILSKHSRAIPSVLVKFHSNKEIFLPWSIEAFNGVTEVDRGPDNAKLFGIRSILQPTKRLKLELLQTVQWGGEGYSNDFKTFSKTFFSDSNNGPYKHINKMAGIGFSYDIPYANKNLNLYGQIIGEDESGGLPTCLISMYGFNLKTKLSSLNFTIGFETVDTRTYISSSGNCGENAAYNNRTYSYTHYNKVLGAEVDTEGNSLELYSSLALNNSMSAEYSIKKQKINDSNLATHRLSSSRREGFNNSLLLNWKKDKLTTKFGLFYQDFTLENINLKKGAYFTLSTSLKF